MKKEIEIKAEITFSLEEMFKAFKNGLLDYQVIKNIVYDGKTHETNISIPINGEKGLTIKLNRKVKFWL